MPVDTKKQRLAKLERNVGDRSPARNASMDLSVDAELIQHASVLDEVRSCLRSSSHASIRLLDCAVENGAVVLEGEVSSYYLKQIAQELVRRLGLSHRIFNAVNVISPETR